MEGSDASDGADGAVGPNRPDASEIAAYEEREVTAREALRRARAEALDKQGREMGWLMLFGVGPAALVAIVLAIVFGRPDLVVVFGGLGATVQLWRVWRDHQRIKDIERELDDPIDGS